MKTKKYYQDKLPDNKIITKAFLNRYPECIFVFGDNLKRFGKNGAARLRDHKQSYGFITKKYPNHSNTSHYKPEEYQPVFERELKKLEMMIKMHPHRMFLITQLGGGLANKYGIFKKVIKPGLKVLEKYDNVIFLFDV